MNILINENQYIFLQKSLIQENTLLNENQWYNTLGDIIGIFDPSGVVDFVNGISYMKQGDYVFGILSMISVLPFIGDLAAKPLLLFGKSGRVIRNAEIALKMSKAGDVAGATKIIQDLSKSNKYLSKIVNSVSKWSNILITKIDNLPIGILARDLRNTIIDWIKLLQNANQGSKAAGRLARRTSSKIAKGKVLTPQEATDILKQMKKLAQQDSRLFSGLGGKPKFGALRDPKQYAKWSWESFKKYPFSGGVGRFFGNRQVRALMRKTKWYLGFLDYLGLGNYVGPEELSNQVGDYTNDLNQYAQTPEAQKYWNEDFKQATPETETETTPQQTQVNKTNKQQPDLLTKLLFGGIPGIKPGIPGV